MIHLAQPHECHILILRLFETGGPLKDRGWILMTVWSSSARRAGQSDRGDVRTILAWSCRSQKDYSGGAPGVGAPREVIMNQSVRPDPLLDGVRVLVVDDHAVVREVITELLEDFGARVIAVPGVPEALESLERERPNVVLSDIEMPGEDGYALIRKVRALPPDRGGQTPAAALTGLSTPADRARALQAGFQDHVAKPVDARQLVRIVTTLAAKG